MDNPTERPRILIVDESRMVRATLIKLIRDHYSFREETNGESAWQTLVLDPAIRLVICSPALPILDGDGLLVRIRASRLARIRQLPVLMIIGDNEEANERARTLGASDFIGRGIGATELLTRIASLRQLAAMQSEAGDVSARHTPHPDTGLPRREAVDRHATQALSAAARQQGPVSALLVGFDRFAALRAEHGDDLAHELQKRLASMLSRTVRKEDSLGHYSDDELAIVSPGTPYPACEVFANRLREAIAVANITVHGQRLDVSISIGVASTPIDSATSAAALLGLAAERLRLARQAGGNRVVSSASQSVSEVPAPRLSHAIDLIRAGHESAVVPHLVHLGREILPFLELLERELKLELPLADIRKRMLDREQESLDNRQA